MTAQQTEFTRIETDDELRQWCDHAAGARFFSIDTEFERSRTYFAELCLIQIAADDEITLVDTLTGLDLNPLFACLSDPRRRKVLHAARQDLEVLYFAGMRDFAPLEDTQVAAALCGFSEQVGYAELVEALLQVTLDKSQTRTDWTRRPLSAKQQAYAADDVRYLGEVDERLARRLADAGRLEWWREDCASLYDLSQIDPPAALAWQRVKGLNSVPATAFRRGARLAEWREQAARERNLPRSWVLKDPVLMQLALKAPTHRRAMSEIIGDDAGFMRRDGEAILAVLDGDYADMAVPARVTPLTPEERKQVKSLSAAIGERARRMQVPASCLMTRREMEVLVRGQLPARLDTGWRAHELADLLGSLAHPV